MSWKKQKGKQHSGVCFPENFHQRDTERQLFFSPPFSPSFFGSRKRGFDYYISKYQTGSSPCVVLWTLLLKIFFFLHSPFLPFWELGKTEKKHLFTARKKKKKKRKENKNKTMKTVMLCPTAHLCFSRNLFLVGGLRVHHSSHVESFLFYIFWSNQFILIIY
jgi:hypothetical protein